MQTWEEFRNYIREIDPQGAQEMDRREELIRMSILIHDQRESLGMSQKNLAKMCGVPL